MFRRVFLKPKKKIVEEKIFNTKCKIQGKCCDLIIDGERTENIVYKEVINNLTLKCAPHLSA
jgi:hypothetical protein